MHDGDSRSCLAVLTLRSGSMVLREEHESPICLQLDCIRDVPRKKAKVGLYATFWMLGICIR